MGSVLEDNEDLAGTGSLDVSPIRMKLAKDCLRATPDQVEGHIHLVALVTEEKASLLSGPVGWVAVRIAGIVAEGLAHYQDVTNDSFINNLLGRRTKGK